jgi:hypothetical protein
MPGMVLACLSLLVTSGRAAELPANLEAAKRNYEGAISTAERDCRTRTQALNQEYAKSLDQLQDNAQANGDLDSVMATKSEKERYLKARTVTEADLSSSSAVLRSVQTQFLRASIGFEIEKNERLLGLARNHEAILTELEKELTKQGNFDEAVKVREERDLISSSPVISQIEYQLASLRVSLKRIAPETIASPAAGETPAAPRGEEWDTVGGPNVTIYPHGTSPPRSTDVVLKRPAGMSATDRGRSLHWVSAAVQFGEREVSDTRSGIVRAEQTQNFLRIVLGSRSVEKTIIKPTAVVEYFTRPSGGSGINRTSTEIIRLPNFVGSERTTIDTAGVRTGQRVVTTRRVRRVFGTDYYGFVLSVFNGDGDLVYQCAAPSQLKDKGIDKIPGGAVVASPVAPMNVQVAPQRVVRPAPVQAEEPGGGVWGGDNQSF